MNADLRIAAEAAEILMDRMRVDPLRTSEDYGCQGLFLESDKAECWLFGANRSGKSHSLAKKVACFARFGHHRPSDAGRLGAGRPVSILVISVTHDNSRNVIQPKIFNNGSGVNEVPFIPDSEIESWNVTNQTLFLKNGSKIIFKSCQDGATTFAGYDADMIAFDEPPDEDVYKECTFRVGGGRRLLIRGAATVLPPPGQPGGVSWVYRKKIAPWMETGKNAGNPDLDIFSMSIYENPLIQEAELRRLESSYPVGSPEYLIRMKGVLLASIGGAPAYPSFMREYHINPNLGPEKLIPFLPLCLCCDFNPENGVWLVGQKHGQTFKVYDEITLERSDVASMVHEFRSRYPQHQAEIFVYGDATGRRRSDQTGESNYFMIAEYLSGYPAPIRYFIPAINPPVNDRVSAVNRLLRPSDGQRRFEMASRCVETAADFEGTKWKQNGVLDKAGGRRSDGADAFGYWAVQDSPVVRPIAGSRAQLKTIRSPGGFRPISGQPFPATVRSIRSPRRQRAY